MKITDYEAVNNIAERISDSTGHMVEFDWYYIILVIGKNRFRLMENESGNEMQVRAISEKFAKQAAIQILAMGGWPLANDDGLILEVERLFAS